MDETDLSHVQREIQYRNIPKRILMEKLLGDGVIAPTIINSIYSVVWQVRLIMFFKS